MASISGKLTQDLIDYYYFKILKMMLIANTLKQEF